MRVLDRASPTPLQGNQVVTVIGLDNRSFDDIEVLAEVARIVGKAFAVAGPDVPALSDPAWLTAPPAAKVARLLVIAEANLISNPYEIAAQMVKDGSMAISADGRWSAARALPRTPSSFVVAPSRDRCISPVTPVARSRGTPAAPAKKRARHDRHPARAAPAVPGG